MHKERPTHLAYKVENHAMDPLNVSDHSLVTATVRVVLKNTKTKDQTQFITKNQIGQNVTQRNISPTSEIRLHV